MAGARPAEAPAAGPPLERDFFDRGPRQVAVDLIDCTLSHRGVGGVIVEAEAYEQDDPACHAFIGRTGRTEVLFGPPGLTYVYLCYGIHRMFNIVTNRDGVAAAVLIRALEPTRGLDRMRRRRGFDCGDRELCSGPGKLCEALGIELELTRLEAFAPPFEILAPPPGRVPPEIASGPRIGISKGAELPWRYCAVGSRFLSRAPAPSSTLLAGGDAR